MQDFLLYFQLGWEHILDPRGYDHILFITTLCSVYILRDWKKVLWLVTAFTIGHSLTLALSVFDHLRVSGSLIEVLIPLTIIFTALYHINQKDKPTKYLFVKYTMALIFGLIHGLGFSNYLKSLLGKQSSIIGELLAFNIGLEFGQVLIVGIVLLVCQFMLQVVAVRKSSWNLFISSAVFGIALVMCIERIVSL